jgi:hypothetical protein
VFVAYRDRPFGRGGTVTDPADLALGIVERGRP